MVRQTSIFSMSIFEFSTGNVDIFESFIRFPKLKDTAYGFDELIKKYDKDTIAGYELEIIGNEIYVTEKVNNVLFCKCK